MTKKTKTKTKFASRISLFFIFILFLVSVLSFGYLNNQSGKVLGVGKKVIGYIPSWDQTRAFNSIKNNPGVFSEVSPFWYTANSSGDVFADPNGGPNMIDKSMVSYLKSNGILVVPTVFNLINGTWNASIVSGIINDPTVSSKHIVNLVNLAVSEGYDGIDIDYENLNTTDRNAFSTFIQNLASALHAKGKLLSVGVHPKTSEPGTWNGPQAHDYTQLGKYADEVRIQVYEYHWGTSAPGPIAPISWVNDVLAFASTEIPKGKIIQGIGLYGYDWVGNQGKGIEWLDVLALTQQLGIQASWDTPSESPYFKYSNHEVWFENHYSTSAKLDMTNKYDVGGVFFWRLGGEDPSTWAVVKNKIYDQGVSPTISATPIPTTSSGTTPTPTPTQIQTPTPTQSSSGVTVGDITPPTVKITSLNPNFPLVRKQKIEAAASDNVGVTKVEFYIDGLKVATDNSSPYRIYWNTSRLVKNKLYIIKAKAYDAAGNYATHEVSIMKL